MTLTNQLKQIIQAENLIQANVAKEIGVSASIFSSYLSGSYSGNVENVERKVRYWLAGREKREKVFVEAPHFIVTETAKKAFSAFDMAKILPTMVTVYGASGVGKTKAAQEYKKQNSNVFLITSSPSRATLSSILYELALELGVNDAPRRKDRLARLVTKKLIGTQGLVIVDESDHLPYDALEELRIIQEEAEIGLVLIGNDKVYTRIQGGVNQAHEYARLWSRVGKHFPFKRSQKGDIKAIAEAWGLDTAEKELMTLLYEIGSSAGGLRSLNQYLRIAGMMAKGQGTVVDLPLILAAQAQMKGIA